MNGANTRINYAKQVKSFCNFIFMNQHRLSDFQFKFYFYLLELNNRLGWDREWIQLTRKIVMSDLNMTNARTYTNALKALDIQRLIDYRPGANKVRPALYRLIPLEDKFGNNHKIKSGKIATDAATQPATTLKTINNNKKYSLNGMESIYGYTSN